jgi:DNA polymerase elongation subunit (family B)
MKFYTNVEVWGGRILYRGVEEGRRVRHKVEYHPSLFVPSQTPTKYKTIHGEYVGKVKPGNIRDARDFVSQYDNVENFKVYGNTRYQYCFIADEFKGVVDWDMSLIKVANIDIEVGEPPEGGFPEPEHANGPLTAITIKMDGQFTTLGCGEYNNKRDDVVYIKCADEFDLIRKFLGWWQSEYPDIITGWNVQNFDIPYLVNRIRKLMGENEAKKLSPWGVINDKMVDLGMNRKIKSYSILGIATLDLLDLYQRYAKDGKSQESYKLDSIAHVELGERKLSYEEYGSLLNLYKEDYQKFIDYNIKDVDLVDKIDDKNKLIELALTLSYYNKGNYEDVFAQVRMWDVICFHHLKGKNVVVPPIERHEKEAAYVGAYVKDTINGFHNWVASFDVNSEYPSVIMGSNISPETIIEPVDYDDAMRSIISDGVSVDRLLARKLDLSGLKNKDVCLTANGQFYRRDKQGFMPEMVEKMFADRKVYKKKMLDAEQEYEKEKQDPAKRKELKDRIARYNNLQLSKKVSLNSLYGALGSKYFRFFDLRNAIAVTTTGQLSIRWIENSLNNYLQKLLKTEEDYVIAVDTDSVYLRLGPLVDKTINADGAVRDSAGIISFLDKVCENKIQPVIDNACRELGEYTNVFQQKIVMKREVLADKAIWTNKKRYILNVHNSEGVQYAQPKKKVLGLEMVKSSTPSACRDKLREAIDVIFDKDETAIQSFIQVFRSEFETLPLADIAFPRGLNGLVKYADKKTIYGSGTPIHVRGALVYNHFLRNNKLDTKYPLIQNGEKLKFMFLKEPNTIQSNVISFPQGGIPEEFALSKYIDYNTQFTKAFLDPLKIILDSIGWQSEKTSSLEDFFS